MAKPKIRKENEVINLSSNLLQARKYLKLTSDSPTITSVCKGV